MKGPADTARVLVRGAGKFFPDARGAPLWALEDCDLTIAAGEFVALIGPSGCGKSTLLRLVAGLLRPSRGEVLLAAAAPGRTATATVFQEYSIFPWRTVHANVRFGLDVARVPRREADARARARIERVGLGDFAGALPGQLSGGMKQRVALARALVMEPEILLMDEPFAAIDAQLRRLLQDELLRIWQAEGQTVLFVTHSIEEAVLLADRVLVMTARPGRVKAEFRVDLPRPRDGAVRKSPVFSGLTDDIWRALEGEVRATLATQEALPE